MDCNIDAVTVVYIDIVYKLISAWSEIMLEVLVHVYCIPTIQKQNIRRARILNAHCRATRFSTWPLT